MKANLLNLCLILFLNHLYGQDFQCPKGQKYIDKRKSEEQNGKTIINAPLECYSDWAMYYALRCECEQGVESKEKADYLINRIKNKRRYIINMKRTECNLGEGLPSPITSCPIKDKGNNDGQSESSKPTAEEIERKFYEGVQAGVEKHQEYQDRADQLRQELSSDKGVQKVYIRDRSNEARYKENYDPSNDLDKVFKELNLDYEKDKPKISSSKKEELAKMLKKMELNSPPTRKAEDIVRKSVYYEINELRYSPCENNDIEDDFYSGIHEPGQIEINDLANTKWSNKWMDHYKDEIIELYSNSYGGKLVGRAAEYAGKLIDQAEAIQEALDTKETLDDIQDVDGLFEELLTQDWRNVDDWFNSRKDDIESLIIEKFQLPNWKQAIEVMKTFENKMNSSNHDEILESNCGDLNQLSASYKNSVGKMIEEVLETDKGILKTLFYGFGF